MSSSDFVTPDPPERIIQPAPPATEKTAPNNPPKANIKGLKTAGWVLAFLFPFLGVFINLWLIRNRNKYDVNTVSASIALTISVILSAVLLILLFQTIFVLVTPVTSV